ncbi:hypothetical protein [Halorussus halophilus]|uniref:hypothetical protein n=1 Tax=Halorussus halophilus TaxID=2650975 RepID=UPI0013011706|nr:hypothetical protein [Halorussus halophilus]
MVNWQLIGRCGTRYTVVYGGLTAAVVALLGSPMLLLGLVCVGLVLLLFVAGGTGEVRMGTAMANADAAGYNTAVVDPVEDDLQAKAMDGDIKLLFYGVGLVVFGFGALVAVAGLT